MTTQITPTTELQSVNTMLSVIGEAPVNSITGTTTVDVSVAKYPRRDINVCPINRLEF